MNQPVPTLLVANNPTICFALESSLSTEPSINLIGEARSIQDALAFIKSDHPLIAVISHEPPALDGIDLAQQITLRQLPVKAILIAAESADTTSLPDVVAMVCDYWHSPLKLPTRIACTYRQLVRPTPRSS